MSTGPRSVSVCGEPRAATGFWPFIVGRVQVAPAAASLPDERPTYRSPALATDAMAALIRGQVVTRQRVPAFAMSLASVDRVLATGQQTHAAVLGRRDCPKVRGPHTAAVAADVVNLVAIGYLAHEQAVAGAVRRGPCGSCPTKRSVPGRTTRRSPFPAVTAGVDFGPPANESLAVVGISGRLRVFHIHIVA